MPSLRIPPPDTTLSSDQAVSLLSRNVLRRVEKAAADDPRATSWKLEQDDGRGLSRLCPCWHQ